MKRKCALIFFVCALQMGGCATIRVHRETSPRPSKPLSPETYKIVAFGIKPLSEPISLSNRCPSGWEDISTEVSPLQMLWGALSLNIYSPWTVKVSCR